MILILYHKVNNSRIAEQKIGDLGYNFIDGSFVPAGRDEYYLRNAEVNGEAENRYGGDIKARLQTGWRALTKNEIDELIKNGNRSPSWEKVLVRDPFSVQLVTNNFFYGLVRIGRLSPVLLKHHDFVLPAGIRYSTIISCDIGDNCAIQNCSYISHYIIGDFCILSSIDEAQCSNHAKFGNGIVKDGETEAVRINIDVMNEAGGRHILPFDKMIPADSYIWAANRDDAELIEKLKTITDNTYSKKRGYYGIIGRGAVVKSCAIIKDVMVGEYAYIKGANKLKNLTILSSEDEATQIGEGVEIVNGIVGYGCHIFYGAKAIRFVMGRSCNLKYGARLIHSVLGDNSTVSCCEILNNLVYPFHEQHHNNSFLIAALVMGMSNLAAGTTIGSNHNSRSNDGELRAGRGFWPSLSVSLKHPSRFASYTMLAKGNYPHELDIRFPFTLVNNNVGRDRLELRPAYFLLHNMYALERNSWKIKMRDRRKVKLQHIEMDYLAPDTAEEIISAVDTINKLLEKDANGNGEVSVTGVENSKRDVVILKPREAVSAYNDALHYYACKSIIAYLTANPRVSYDDLINKFNSDMNDDNDDYEKIREWENAGGQLMPKFTIDELKANITSGKFSSWDEIHEFYDKVESSDCLYKTFHAISVLKYLNNKIPRKNDFIVYMEKALEIKKQIVEKINISRQKDYDNPFALITYKNKSEMEAVRGAIKDNAFIKASCESLASFENDIKNLIGRI